MDTLWIEWSKDNLSKPEVYLQQGAPNPVRFFEQASISTSQSPDVDEHNRQEATRSRAEGRGDIRRDGQYANDRSDMQTTNYQSRREPQSRGREQDYRDERIDDSRRLRSRSRPRWEPTDYHYHSSNRFPYHSRNERSRDEYRESSWYTSPQNRDDFNYRPELDRHRRSSPYRGARDY